MTFSYDIFLSHNKADKDRVRQLAERLRDEGFRVWFDDWVIEPGDDIVLAIEHGLEAARVLVLCLSIDALSSEWVKLERSTVLFRDPTNIKRRFIPMLFDDCQLPDTLKRYKYIDFRQGTDDAFNQLITACYKSKTISTDELALTNTSDADISLKQSESPHELVSTTKPSWVWFSTPDSFATSKVSILAIIETILASMIYLLIAFKYGTAHLTIAVLLAPILLLRTDESVKYALEHSKQYDRVSIKDVTLPVPLQQSIFFLKNILISWLVIAIWGYFLNGDNEVIDIKPGGAAYLEVTIGTFMGVYILAFGLVIRAWATIRFALINPSKSLSNIPINWWNQIASLDTFYPPELVPGVIKYEATKNYVSRLQPFAYLYVTIMRLHIFGQGNHAIITVATFPFIAIPVYFYRWSIKGTAILMLPMIGLLYDSKTTKPEHIKNSLVMNTLFRVSCFMLLYAILILILRTFEIDLGFNESIQKFLWLNDPHGIIKRVFPENEIMLWQLFLILTAFLTFYCHLYADRLINRGYSNNRLWWFRQLLSTIGLSAVCLIFSLIYLSASIAHFG